MGFERGPVSAPPGAVGRPDSAGGRPGWGRDHRGHDRGPTSVNSLSSRFLTAVGLVLALLGGTAGAQEAAALAEFGRSFDQAVRTTEDLPAAIDLLDRAAELIGDLPAERRDQAHFWVEVRRGEHYLRRGNPDDLQVAAEITRAARDRARETGVYRDQYRVLALVLLWQTLPPGEFAALVDEVVDGETERDYVLDPQLETTALSRAGYLHTPVRVLRSDLLMGTDDEYRGLGMLRELVSELPTDEPGLLRWRHMSLQRLAWHFMQRYSYDRARVYLEELPEEESLYPRGLIALRMGDHATAEELGLRLAEEREDNRYFQLVGDARELEGRYEEALEAYELAWAAARGSGDRAAARNGRGDALLGLGRLEEADVSYRDALDELTSLPRSLSGMAEWAETIKDLGRLEESRGERQLAFDWYQRSLVALEEARLKIPVDVFGGTWLSQHGDQLTAVDGILRLEPWVARPFLALAATEKLKARSLLDSLAGGRGADDPALRHAIRQLVSASDPDEIQHGLRDLEAERARSDPGDRRGEPLEGEALKQWWRAQRGTLVLSYWLGEDRAWVLRGEGDGELALVHLGPAEEARERLREAFAAVTDPVADPWPALDRAARFFLPRSLDESLARVERILVCADTATARLPFAALRWQGEPLGISHSLWETPSLSVAQVLSTRRGRGAGVVVVDAVINPALEQELGLDPLLFSQREGDLVASAHDQVQRLRGEAATFDNLRQLLAGEPRSLVHVSAHAVDDARVPSQSLLLLADGLVSMRSLAALDLEGSTIVLTACSSAQGADRGREGLVGIPQGVLEAGARAVVAPGWSVNQQATADLMGQFHYFLSAGMDEAQAMAAARGQLAAAENYSHPHFWAGFRVFGAHSGPGATLPWILAGVAVLLLVVVGYEYRRRRSTTAPGKHVVLGAR